MSKFKILSFQIAEELYNLLKDLAEKNYMSISAYSRMLLIQKIKELENDRKNNL